jgi:hypothetical protein
MRKGILQVLFPVLLIAATLLLTGQRELQAGVNVGVNVNLGPPPIAVPAPPAVVMVPNSQVYFVPGVDFDIFFHNGFWWSPRGERWYRARAYNGPWQRIERRHVPRAVVRVPVNYRTAYVRERHIPYGEWQERHFRGKPRDMGERRERGEFRGQHNYREREDYREHDRGHGR